MPLPPAFPISPYFLRRQEVRFGVDCTPLNGLVQTGRQTLRMDSVPFSIVFRLSVGEGLTRHAKHAGCRFLGRPYAPDFGTPEQANLARLSGRQRVI